MTDSATATAPAPAAATPKKAAKGGKDKKPRAKPSHPKTGDMVNAAIKSLKERGGSSLQAIKKYIASTYKVDAEKLAPFIRKYLKSAVSSGSLIQTKGKGASGSFKLPVAGEKAAKKPKAKSGSPKPKAAKKSVKKASPKKPKAAAKPKAPKSPSKAKKTTKAPTKKPKAPKPKKAAKPKSPKKAAPKKK